MSVSDDKSGDIMSIPGAEDQIDPATFEQILEMDEDEVEREFSKSIVYDFFGQAESTFEKMDTGLTNRDLAELSALGHFLKGSSATLGLNRVRDSCEKIQNLGAKKDETGIHPLADDDECLRQIRAILQDARDEFDIVKHRLRRFYRD